MYGLNDEEIAAIREGHMDSFTPSEVALLNMADAMADTPSNVSDDLYVELRRHFSEERPPLLRTSVHVTTVCSTWAAMGCIARDSASKRN